MRLSPLLIACAGRFVISLGLNAPQLIFPLAFSCNLTVTANQIDASSEYPPRVRKMEIYYDYINERARADMSKGYEAEKIYIRRYDMKKEFMIRAAPINDCKRAYLSDLMPYPDIKDAIFSDVVEVNGNRCNHFIVEEGDSRVHIYMSTAEQSPVKLILESTDGSVSTEMLTYEYSNVALNPPDESLFLLPEAYSEDSCIRHTAGFPYLHVFHHFVRF